MERPHGGLAQLVEHLLCTQGVRSSNLLSSTIFKRGRKTSFLVRFPLLCVRDFDIKYHKFDILVGSLISIYYIYPSEVFKIANVDYQ